MKHINSLLFAAIFCLLSFSAQAQVRQEVTSMVNGAKNAYIITLPKCSPKLAEKIWRDYVKKFKGDVEKIKKAEELFTDNVLIPGISSGNNPVDLYARFDAAGDDTRAIVWVDLGGAYVNSGDFAPQSEQVEQLVLKYGIAVAKDQVQSELEDQEKELKNLDGDLKKLIRDNDDSKKDIEDYKAKIKKAEEAIVQNDKDQAAKREAIEKQKKIAEATRARLAKLQ